jgi:hypothetical protein
MLTDRTCDVKVTAPASAAGHRISTVSEATAVRSTGAQLTLRVTILDTQRNRSALMAPRTGREPEPDADELAVWVPDIRSHHATCAYSWINPPSRSRRRTCGCQKLGHRL